MSTYRAFRSELMTVINNHHNTEDIYSSLAILINSNKFCILIVRSIARKFELDYEDLRGELIAEILSGKVFKQVLEKKEFNRQVFYMNIKKLAIKMSMTADKLDFMNEFDEGNLMTNDNLLDNYSNKHSILKYIEIRQANLKKLLDYRHSILNSIITVTHFQSIVNLSISEIIEMLKKYRITRHRLLNNPDKYRKYFIIIIDRYIELFIKYQDVSNNYPAYLKKETQSDTSKALYEKLKPNYSYLQFQRKLRNLSLWDIEELDKLVQKVRRRA